jgi:hypothetical protein
MYVHTVKLVPFRVKTLATFAAPDPWNDSTPAEFTIEAHVLAGEHALRAPQDTGPPYVLGIRSEIDGETHIMPESLSELWNTSRAPSQALPRLLKGIEPSLAKGDLRFYLHARRHIWMLAICGAMALGAFLWAAVGFLRAQPAAAQVQKPPRSLSAADWLQAPMEEMRPIITGGFALEGSRKLSSSTQPPPGFSDGSRGQPDTLAWLRAAEGRRLLLIGGRFTDSMFQRTAMMGFAMRRSALSIPEPVLEDLRASLPGLNTGLIMCFGWRPARLDETFSPWFGIAVGTPLLFCGLLVFIVIRRGQLRRHRQIKQLLAALGAQP